MWPFKKKTRLEKALESIPQTSFKYTFTGSKDDLEVTTRTPIYCVPGKIVEGQLSIGLYLDNQLTYVPIGFSTHRNFREEFYHNLQMKKPFLEGDLKYRFRKIVEERIRFFDNTGGGVFGNYKFRSKKKGLLYLPLKLSETIVTTEDGYGEKKQRCLYSIDGLSEKFPFSILDEADEGIKMYCLCPKEWRHISELYPLKKELGIKEGDFSRVEIFKEDGIEEYLKSLKEGTYTHPQKDEEEPISISYRETKPRKKRVREKPPKKRLTVGSKKHKKRKEAVGKKEPQRPIVTSNEEIDWDRPRSIKSYLDKYIIGQEEAKKKVAVAFSNYMVRVNSDNQNLPKDNIILVGPSGVGKTYMFSLLAKEASLPLAQAKLVGKTTEGYKGENLSDSFEQIKAKTTDESPYGIVFYDEIDKTANDEWASGSGFGPRLQDEIIGWAEEAQVVGINTRNLLFVVAGAFQGVNEGSSLETIVRKRTQGSRTIGFGAAPRGDQQENKKDLQDLSADDLIRYGLKAELVGRFSAMAVLYPLSIEQKIKILKEAKESRLIQYQALFKERGYSLQLEEDVYPLIAKSAPQRTGARGLNEICNDLFSGYLFDLDEFANNRSEIIVTSKQAQKFIRAVA